MDTALGPGHYPEVTTAARSERVTGAFSSSASSCLIRGGRVSGLCFRTENPTKESNEDEVEMKNEEREDEEEGVAIYPDGGISSITQKKRSEGYTYILNPNKMDVCYEA
ncbi:hypothetical protein RB195_012612 [Necator americanus]|uniref:Uncharacterized protein n=1 Tax=Necator americanus TaxID=51031 RepID=A0ABR1DRT9_NECAM